MAAAQHSSRAGFRSAEFGHAGRCYHRKGLLPAGAAVPENCWLQTFLRPADAEAGVVGRYWNQKCCHPAVAGLSIPASDHKQRS